MSAGRAMAVLLLAGLLAACTSSSQVRDSDSGESPAQINTRLGVAYMQRGDYELALEKLQKALRLDSKLTDAHTGIAVLYEQIGRRDAAEKHYRRAVELAPENGNVQNNLGTFLCKTGDYAEAERHFMNALDDPFYKTPEVAYTNAASCAIRVPAPDRAEDYLRSALDVDAEHAPALYQLARLMFERGDYMKARAFVQRYMDAAQPTADVLYLATRVERELGDRRAEQRYAGMLSNNFPDSPEARRLAEHAEND